MLLDLLGAKNPRILNAFGLGAAPLFGVLVDVGECGRGTVGSTVSKMIHLHTISKWLLQFVDITVVP